MDWLSFLGVIIGFAALFGGHFLDGGSWQALVNGPAALIVVGGTCGAAILQTPKAQIARALQLARGVFRSKQGDFERGIKRVVYWSNTARRSGLLGLEKIAEEERDRFAKKGLQMLVDGCSPLLIRDVLETDLTVTEKRDVAAVQFFESMGGYAPTIGIIGAVIGLIHVMRHLADPSQLGPGIAVAFVATIYGVALANLLLIPLANKLKAQIRERSEHCELIIEGITAIADGQNPRAIERKLSVYRHE